MYQAIVIGSSLGGIEALTTMLSALPYNFPVPVIIVQHLSLTFTSRLAEHLNDHSPLTVLTAANAMPIEAGHVYVCPAKVHLAVNSNKTLHLFHGEEVNYALPAIDILFNSAADVYKNKLIGIVLTGLNDDGSRGLKHIKDMGGLAIVQDPDTAQMYPMPRAALAACNVDHIVTVEEIAELLVQITQP